MHVKIHFILISSGVSPDVSGDDEDDDEGGGCLLVLIFCL